MRSHRPSCAATAVILLTSPTTASAHHAYVYHLVMRVIRLPPATGVLRVPASGFPASRYKEHATPGAVGPTGAQAVGRPPGTGARGVGSGPGCRGGPHREPGGYHTDNIGGIRAFAPG